MRRAILPLLLVSRLAFAHQTSIKYVDIVVDGPRADIALKVAPGDVTEPMQLAADSRPSASAAARVPGVGPYVAGWLAIALPTAAGPLACAAGATSVRADEDGFVVVAWPVTCPREIDRVTLDFRSLFALDKRQEAIVQLRDGNGDFTPTVVRAPDSPITLRVAETSPLRWIRLGMARVSTGDHVGFMLAVLLVVMLERKSGWQLKPLARVLRATAGMLAAFAIATSLTVVAAALGWVALPAHLVAIVIGASVAYTAVEDIARPDVRWRFVLTFGFGLALGLQVAAKLAVELPPHGVEAPLVCFDLGVELAQLTIVLVALPMLYLLALAFGAERYRRVALPIMASAILVFGLVRLVAAIAGM